MSTFPGRSWGIEQRSSDASPVFQHPAELVDISERIYRQVFAIGLWVAAGLSAFAAAGSLLEPTAGSQLRGLVVCSFATAACAAIAGHSVWTYALLRRDPWWLAGAGAALGAGAWVVGPHNFELFLPMIAVIGVAGIATPWPVVVASALIAGLGLGLPQVTDGDGNLGGPIAVVVPPLLYWLIVDRIAGFALCLHRHLTYETPGPEESDAPAAEPDHAADPANAPSEDHPRRGLPLPRIITVDGIRLTSRQLQVVMLVATGLRNVEIAPCLGIGAAQVGEHLKKARKRVGVATNGELAAWAERHGLIPSEDEGSA